MSNTIEHLLNDTTWTAVASAGTSGFITNEGRNKVKYRESDITPTDEVGHTLELEVGASINFVLEAGQTVYAKSASGDGRIAVTLN